jgi:hypothetical protein
MSACSICRKPLDDNEDEVNTDSGITFHRTCLQELLTAKPKTDHQVCMEKLTFFYECTTSGTK